MPGLGARKALVLVALLAGVATIPSPGASQSTSAAQRCAQGARELQELVRGMGGDPERSGSAAAALHRGWINIKEAVTGRDDKAILEEVERGEDYAKAQYRKALEQDLPANVKSVVERQYQGVIANHDKVKALRDRYRAAA